MTIRRAVAAACLVALLPSVALAFTGQAQQMMRNWTASDRCAQAARKAFPDYTAEANAKRDAQMKQCLASGNLPPRESLESPTKP